MYNGLDDHGQPTNRAFNAKRLSERGIDELIGLCKGVIADGKVVKAEAAFLNQWLEHNRRTAHLWPANILYERLREMLIDGKIDTEEQKELLGLLREFTGERLTTDKVVNLSTGLPFDLPAPEVIFDNRSFCFTGKLLFGTRGQCEEQVMIRGGGINSRPTKYGTDYLVVGIIGSSDWIHSTHGRKIEAAVELKKEGHSIAIISEEHWTCYL